MEGLVKRIGDVAVTAIMNAIEAGRSRREAMQAAAEAIKREDIVSDDLWDDLDRYIDKTRDFEKNGA